MSQPSVSRKPEVMSPAGYWPQLHAAIEAGADAVYFGLKHFSAAAKVGFSLGDLPRPRTTLTRPACAGTFTSIPLSSDHEFPQTTRAFPPIAQPGASASL